MYVHVLACVVVFVVHVLECVVVCVVCCVIFLSGGSKMN